MEKFTHVKNFTGYMQKVVDIFSTRHPMKILDLPAGNGILADKLEKYGHEVIRADINKEKLNYEYVNMEMPLPFHDNSFDAVICLEGIEHILYPAKLIEEFTRIIKSNGLIIISTPNVQNYYSRLVILFTGMPYQFNTKNICVGAGDRGHISPMYYHIIKYLFAINNCELVNIYGDKFKKKFFMPIYLIILFIDWIRSKAAKTKDKFRLMPALLFSRSLILQFQKK